MNQPRQSQLIQNFKGLLISAIFIGVCLWLGKLISHGLAARGFPIPGSIIGMVLLFLCLSFKAVRLEQFAVVSNLFDKYFGLLFVPAGVGLMTHFKEITDAWFAIVFTTLGSVLLVLIATGAVPAEKIRPAMMETFAAIFWILLTVVAWLLATRLYEWKSSPLFNPVFLSVTGIILLLLTFHIRFEDYEHGGRIIEWLLDPAVVAFAVPLFKHRRRVTENWLVVLGGIGVGSVMGISSAAGLSLLLGASKGIARSMAPKSVTTPIAIRLSEQIGGSPSLTAGLVIVSGILGAMIGPEILARFRIRNPLAIGLAVGTASHGIGTARMAEEARISGDDLGKTMSMVGMTLNGLVTALILPFLVHFLRL